METKRFEDLTETARARLQAGDRQALESLIGRLHPWDAARLVSRLSVEEQKAVLAMLRPAAAADVAEELPDEQAARLISELDPEQAGPIVGEMDSNEEADLLQQLPPERRRQLLAHMPAAEKGEAIELLAHAADTAGGMMMKEYIAFDRSRTVGEVLREMRSNARRYSEFRISYLYVVDAERRLVGVLPLRDLILRDPAVPIGQAMVKDPLHAPVDLDQEEVARLFERYHYLALPVVDAQGRLVGVVSQDDAIKVAEREASEDLLKFSGIVGGEETHDMPLLRRSRRRLAWLSVNILLNLAAAGVIWAHEDTLTAVVAIAMFLPIISDMSGCSGNQSIAVTIRELATGRVEPRHFLKVWWAEASVGLINGAVLGIELGVVAWLLRDSALLGAVVGGALFINTLLSVSIGSVVPLLLKKLGKDPAISSAPILTTLTDLCGFFLLLTVADAVLR